MQTANIEILLNGELTTTIVKPVTPAEAVILRHLHGDDALINGKALADSSVSNEDEVERLKLVYGDKVFAVCFPGALPKLPATFAEAKVEVEGFAAPKAAKSKEA
jgi:hypothetical protein